MKTIRPGQLVYWRNQAAIVLELKGFSDAILRTVDDARTEIASVSDLALAPSSETPPSAPHLLAKDKEWDTAVERYELISPLLNLPGRETRDVQRIADTAGKSLVTIYRWLNRFEETGLVSSLLRTPRSDKGGQRLSEEIEQIITLQIQNYYLKQERPSVLKLYRRIKQECLAADLDPPHKNTIYARANELEQRDVLSKRYSPKLAREKFEPLRGHFPGANYPNAVVQIDHTKVDVIVVDEEHRLPLRQPSLLHEPMLAGKILAMCEGTIGELSMLLNLAATHAIRQGNEQITADVLSTCGYVSPSDRTRQAARV